MADQFENIRPALESPCEGLLTVTPDDGADLAQVSRALYIGGAGDVAVTLKDGSTGTFSSAPAGMILPIRATRVLATGTTATNIIAMF